MAEVLRALVLLAVILLPHIGQAQQACPPTTFAALPQLDLSAFTAWPWYHQQQLPSSSVPARAMFCQRTVFTPLLPSNVTAGFIVSTSGVDRPSLGNATLINLDLFSGGAAPPATVAQSDAANPGSPPSSGPVPPWPVDPSLISFQGPADAPSGNASVPSGPVSIDRAAVGNALTQAAGLGQVVLLPLGGGRLGAAAATKLLGAVDSSQLAPVWVVAVGTLGPGAVDNTSNPPLTASTSATVYSWAILAAGPPTISSPCGGCAYTQTQPATPQPPAMNATNATDAVVVPSPPPAPAVGEVSPPPVPELAPPTPVPTPPSPAIVPPSPEPAPPTPPAPSAEPSPPTVVVNGSTAPAIVVNAPGVLPQVYVRVDSLPRPNNPPNDTSPGGRVSQVLVQVGAPQGLVDATGRASQALDRAQQQAQDLAQQIRCRVGGAFSVLFGRDPPCGPPPPPPPPPCPPPLGRRRLFTFWPGPPCPPPLGGPGPGGRRLQQATPPAASSPTPAAAGACAANLGCGCNTTCALEATAWQGAASGLTGGVWLLTRLPDDPSSVEEMRRVASQVLGLDISGLVSVCQQDCWEPTASPPPPPATSPAPSTATSPDPNITASSAPPKP